MKKVVLAFAIILSVVVVRFVYINLTGRHYLKMNNHSMEPALKFGDTVLIDHDAYQESDPKKDDIVAFALPIAPDTFLISRIKSVPGQTVDLEGGQGQIILKPGEYFLVGDNLENSHADSRNLGPIKREQIQGEIKTH